MSKYFYIFILNTAILIPITIINIIIINYW